MATIIFIALAGVLFGSFLYRTKVAVSGPAEDVI